MPTPPTPPNAPEQPAKPIMGNYDVSNADIDELKRALKQFYRFAKLEQDEVKKKKYLDSAAEIEAELKRRESNVTKIPPHIAAPIIEGTANAFNRTLKGE